MPMLLLISLLHVETNCYTEFVRGKFMSTKVNIEDGKRILNQREELAEKVLKQLLLIDSAEVYKNLVTNCDPPG